MGWTALIYCNSVFLKYHVGYNISIRLFVVWAFWIRTQRSFNIWDSFNGSKKKNWTLRWIHLPQSHLPCSVKCRFSAPDLVNEILWGWRLEISLLNKLLDNFIIKTQLTNGTFRKVSFGPSPSLQATPTPPIMLPTLSVSPATLGPRRVEASSSCSLLIPRALNSVGELNKWSLYTLKWTDRC